MKFPESKLAHFWCKGKGVEIGAAAHNPFNLKDCLFLAHYEKIDFWKESEINMCGEFITPDIIGDAENIPLEDNSLDYVISSHVIEHVPNPIKAFLEWKRVLKNQGIVFMIFPKKDADPNDVNRPLSEISEFYKQYNNPENILDSSRHFWVFSLSSMVSLINYCNKEHNLSWDIIDSKETDDKVGNGHCIVMRINK